jgi:putative transposase
MPSSVQGRRTVVDEMHPEISIVRQCGLLGLNRSSYYRKPSRKRRENTVELMVAIDEIYTAHPFFGARSIRDELRDRGIRTSRRRIRQLMLMMGLETLSPRPNTSRPGKGHAIYPYLLRGMAITRPNQVWASDITYVRMPRGWCYLTVIMDWCSRRVLTWRLSNTLDSSFCVEALEEALARFGRPEIFNTDQGSQYTGKEFTGVLKEAGIRISMNGKGRALDNVMVERLWRTIKYEEVYLKSYVDMVEARGELEKYINWYNGSRKHSSLGKLTPDAVYYERKNETDEAA